MARKRSNKSTASGCGSLLLLVLALYALGKWGWGGAIVLLVIAAIAVYSYANRKPSDDEVLAEANRIKAAAKRERDIASAHEIVAAHKQGTFDYDQLGNSAYPL